MMHRMPIAAMVASVLMPATAHAQDHSALINAVGRDVAQFCNAGSPLSFDPEGLQTRGDVASVDLGAFSCSWEFGSNGYCGARACEVRTFRWDGARWVQTGSRLE
jgi:hypothetical protein